MKSYFFVNLLYNSLQSVANQVLAKCLLQHFKVIYPDVRSMIVGNLVENITFFYGNSNKNKSLQNIHYD